MGPGVREGMLPMILSALINSRAATRKLLKETEDPSQRAVLDSRQKALKLTANALYGFTGKTLLLDDSYFLVIFRITAHTCIHLMPSVFSNGLSSTVNTTIFECFYQLKKSVPKP